MYPMHEHKRRTTAGCFRFVVRLAMLATAMTLGSPTTGWAGEISGIVLFRPKLTDAEYRKQMERIGQRDGYGAAVPERFDYKSALSRVVVYVEEVPGKFQPPSEPAIITQKKAAFTPDILPILVGTTVGFPNKDVFFHNVFSFSKTKPFDLGLYKSGASKSVTFTKTGQVTIYCSIHRTMKADILVLQNPFFTMPDARGNFKITNVPDGKFTLTAWHERFPESSVDVDLSPDKASVAVELPLGVMNLPKIE